MDLHCSVCARGGSFIQWCPASHVSAPRIAPLRVPPIAGVFVVKMSSCQATLPIPLATNKYYMAVVLAVLDEDVKDVSSRVMSQRIIEGVGFNATYTPDLDS